MHRMGEKKNYQNASAHNLPGLRMNLKQPSQGSAGMLLVGHRPVTTTGRPPLPQSLGNHSHPTAHIRPDDPRGSLSRFLAEQKPITHTDTLLEPPGFAKRLQLGPRPSNTSRGYQSDDGPEPPSAEELLRDSIPQKSARFARFEKAANQREANKVHGKLAPDRAVELLLHKQRPSMVGRISPLGGLAAQMNPHQSVASNWAAANTPKQPVPFGRASSSDRQPPQKAKEVKTKDQQSKASRGTDKTKCEAEKEREKPIVEAKPGEVKMDISKAHSLFYLPCLKRAAKNLRFLDLVGKNYRGTTSIHWHDRLDIPVSKFHICRLGPQQRINRFLTMQYQARKNPLAKKLNRLQSLYPQAYNFMPRSWRFPAEVANFRKNARKTNADGAAQYYILKPDNGSKGQGIALAEHSKVIQTWIEMMNIGKKKDKDEDSNSDDNDDDDDAVNATTQSLDPCCQPQFPAVPSKCTPCWPFD